MRAHGIRVVRRMRTIRGADFDEFCAGAAHHVGDAERAADFHQFTARYEDLATIGNCIQHQQHRGGVVVDHGGRLCARQLAEQWHHQIIPVAAATAAQIIFQIDGSTERAHHGLLHRDWQQRPS